MTCCCCSSYCRTFSLWICALLGLMAIQVAIDRTVQQHLGQAATGLLLMIVITVRYNPFDFCCPKKGCAVRKARGAEEEESNKAGATTTQVAKAKDAEETQEVVEPSEITGAASGDSSDSSTPLVEEEEGLVPPTVSPADDNPQEDSPTTSKRRPRLAFLDNLKSFLAALVVTLHVSCAFGACHGFWFLILGETSDPPFWAHATRQLSMLLQGFFMPLFFFVSACFVPTSLQSRTKESFYKAKRKRLYYPAMFVILTLVPLCAAIGNWMADMEPMYLCLPGHCWFNLWLLGLHWVYVTLTEARSRDAMKGIQSKCSGEEADDAKPIHDDPPTIRPFPSTVKRMASSMLICGVLLLPFLGAAGGITFAGMPMLNGSLTCDFFMYAMGVMASNNGWLERPLREQMDIPPWIHRCIVMVEAAAMATLYQLYDLQRSINIGPAVGFFLISAMYTVDMGLMLVELFQTYMNTTNPCSRSFSKAAYTVYLIHPLVITSLSALMLQLPFLRDTITFEDSSTAGQFLHLLAPPGQGGEEYYIQSWLMLLVASQLVVWPLSWGIANIPFLSTIL